MCRHWAWPPVERHPWDMQCWQPDRQVCRHKVAGGPPYCLLRSCLRSPCEGLFPPLSFPQSTFIVGAFLCANFSIQSYFPPNLHPCANLHKFLLSFTLLFISPTPGLHAFQWLSPVAVALSLIYEFPVFLSSSAVFSFHLPTSLLLFTSSLYIP